MTKKIVMAFFLFTSVLALSTVTFAHHGNTAYDTSKTVVLKGAVVTKFVWANPHSFVMVDVKDDKGGVLHWTGEAGSPSSLALLGWTKNAMQPGDVITVYIYQSKTGHTVGRLTGWCWLTVLELKDSALGYKDIN